MSGLVRVMTSSNDFCLDVWMRGKSAAGVVQYPRLKCKKIAIYMAIHSGEYSGLSVLAMGQRIRTQPQTFGCDECGLEEPQQNMISLHG